MWYNGTSLSEKARRAMENEKVTIVSHISGYIHTLYNDATIDKDSYSQFSNKLKEFLITDLTNLIFINFLRFKSKYKTLFQYCCECSGKLRYIALDKLFEYEHTSKHNVSSESRASLVKEIEGDEFHLSPIQGKIMLNDIETLLDKNIGKNLKEVEFEFMKFASFIDEEIIHEMFKELKDFIFTDPEIPDIKKNFVSTGRFHISPDDSREKILNLITSQADKSEQALLTLYVYRQMDKIDWVPFIKAAVERNPVCFTDINGQSITDVYNLLVNLPDESIYDGKRLALPDEVWNFRRGDGIEKAFLLADFLLHRDGSQPVTIHIENKKVLLTSNGIDFHFVSNKNLKKSIQISGTEYKVD
jgi:hypothetical protein